MRTLLEILQLSTQHLEKSGIESARRQAEELIADALNISRMQLYLEHDRPLQENEISLIRERLLRRAKGEPNPYIRGLVEFHDCLLKITPEVIIPRQETAILVDMIISELKGQDLKGKILLDLCCGSGYIGIALKKRLPDLQVILLDLCPNALRLARENGAGLDLEFLQGDLLQPFEGRKAHFVVCNPPYISEEEFPQLDREVREFEPRHALVSGPTGLEFYVRLVKELPPHLFPGARVWFEMGYTQGPALQQLFQSPPWKRAEITCDWSGHQRFFSLENE